MALRPAVVKRTWTGMVARQSRWPCRSSSSVSTTVSSSSSTNFFTVSDESLPPVRIYGFLGNAISVINPFAQFQGDNREHSKSSPASAPSAPAPKNFYDEVSQLPRLASIEAAKGQLVDYNTSVCVFANFCVAWRPTRVSEITPASISLVEILNPRPSLILFGTGRIVEPLPAETAAYLARLKIGYEVYNSEAVTGTFNILALDEGRSCGAFILRPDYSSSGATGKEAPTAFPSGLSKRTDRPSTNIRKRIEEQLRKQKELEEQFNKK